MSEEYIEEEFDLGDLDKKEKSSRKFSIWILLIFILMLTLAFGLGRLSKIEDSQVPIKVEYLEGFANAGFSKSSSQENFTTEDLGQFVASKNGTKYHYPSCPGAKQISEENKIWFNTKEEAELAGYGPAGNCPGL